MRKIMIPIFLIIVLIFFVIIIAIPRNNNKEISNNFKIANNDIVQNDEISHNIITENKSGESMNKVYIKINSIVLDIELENNSATKELKERLKNGDIIVNAHEYGGFEKVGDLGFSLPKEDTDITTSAGDIVLYQGNKVSLFYNSNLWSFTKLGKIQNVSSDELKNILGNGDVTITFTLF